LAVTQALQSRVFTYVAFLAANACAFAAKNARESACTPLSDSYLLPPSDSANSRPCGLLGSEQN